MSEIPSILKTVFQQKSVQLPDGEAIALSSNIGIDEVAALGDLVLSLKPQTSLEIGFAQGVSTVAILHALDQLGAGEHHVIDPFQHKFHNAGLSLVAQAGLSDRMRFHHDFPESVIGAVPRVDFAFIDSSHLFDLTLLDFVLVDKKLNEGGVIGFHDMWMPSLRKLLRFILKNRAYELYPKLDKQRNGRTLLASCLNLLPMSDKIFSVGLLNPWSTYAIPNMVFIQKKEEDSRDWRHYVDF